MRAVPTPLIALLLATWLAGCGSFAAPGGGAPDRPNNPKAIAPIAIVAQGAGPAGEYRVWAYHTSDGMACVEVGSKAGVSSGCDPAADRPLGGGVNRSDGGVIAWADTGAASAASAVVRDSTGANVTVALIDVGPSLAGIKVAVANLGPSANPVSIDFLDATGAKVDSVTFR